MAVKVMAIKVMAIKVMVLETMVGAAGLEPATSRPPV